MVALRGFLLALLLIGALLGGVVPAALAGTETGEFCPTCPDWTNLDGWLAKKEAYERAQLNGAANPLPNPATTKAENSVPGYTRSELLTAPQSSFEGFLLLDSRSPADYQKGHLPGARNLYWMDTQKDGLPDPALAEGALRQAGVNSGDRILIYGDEGPEAAYLFWLLSYLGFQNLSVLDGGFEAATASGQKPEESPSPHLPSNYTANPVAWLLVNQSQLGPTLNQSGLQILDARDFSDYGRARLTAKAIPFGADKLYDNLRMKDAATLEDLLERRGLDRNHTQLVYGTPQAYSLFFGLRLMGYNATLLAGDWWMQTEWSVSNVR